MSSQAIETVDRGPNIVARRVTVDLPASEIFARLEDPRRHHELDGSGTVNERISGPEHLSMGDKFTVGMKQLGVPYRITSTVVSFEKDRLVEWRHPAGHTWRWELEPTEDGRTRVTEIWDASKTPAGRVFKLFGMEKRNAKGIEDTLRNLQGSQTSV